MHAAGEIERVIFWIHQIMHRLGIAKGGAELRTNADRRPDIRRGNISYYLPAVLTQLAIFVVRKLAVIVAGVLARAENVHDFVWPFRHYRMKYDAVDQRENCGVNTDRQREREYRYRSEPWRL